MNVPETLLARCDVLTWMTEQRVSLCVMAALPMLSIQAYLIWIVKPTNPIMEGKKMKIGQKFNVDRLGEVTVYSIESWHTIVVVDARGKFYRISGLSKLTQ